MHEPTNESSPVVKFTKRDCERLEALGFYIDDGDCEVTDMNGVSVSVIRRETPADKLMVELALPTGHLLYAELAEWE
jgi:hypothetical protein